MDCDSGLCKAIFYPLFPTGLILMFLSADRIKNVQLALVLTASARRMVIAIRAYAR